MAEPIINPWFFYLIDVFNTITEASMVILMLGFLWSIALAATQDVERVVVFFKKLAIAFVASLTLVVFIPNERTMYKMMIASCITPQNLEYVEGSVDNLLDNIEKRVYRYINGVQK